MAVDAMLSVIQLTEELQQSLYGTGDLQKQSLHTKIYNSSHIGLLFVIVIIYLKILAVIESKLYIFL